MTIIVVSILERKIFRILNLSISDIIQNKRNETIEIGFHEFKDVTTRVEFEKRIREIIKKEIDGFIFLKYSRWANVDINSIILNNRKKEWLNQK